MDEDVEGLNKYFLVGVGGGVFLGLRGKRDWRGGGRACGNVYGVGWGGEKGQKSQKVMIRGDIWRTRTEDFIFQIGVFQATHVLCSGYPRFLYKIPHLYQTCNWNAEIQRLLDEQPFWLPSEKKGEEKVFFSDNGMVMVMVSPSDLLFGMCFCDTMVEELVADLDVGTHGLRMKRLEGPVAYGGLGRMDVGKCVDPSQKVDVARMWPELPRVYNPKERRVVEASLQEQGVEWVRVDFFLRESKFWKTFFVCQNGLVQFLRGDGHHVVATHGELTVDGFVLEPTCNPLDRLFKHELFEREGSVSTLTKNGLVTYTLERWLARGGSNTGCVQGLDSSLGCPIWVKCKGQVYMVSAPHEVLGSWKMQKAVVEMMGRVDVERICVYREDGDMVCCFSSKVSYRERMVMLWQDGGGVQNRKRAGVAVEVRHMLLAGGKMSVLSMRSLWCGTRRETQRVFMLLARHGAQKEFVDRQTQVRFLLPGCKKK